MEPWDRLRRRLGELASTAPPAPRGGRCGAALALLREVGDGDVELVLTRRRDDLSTHPGQVSFPGGRVEPGETVEAAALREAHEECGLDPATATVLGSLPAFYIPPSRFWLQVVVARWDAPHPLRPAEAEVAELLAVRSSALADPDRWRAVHLSARGSSWAWALDGGHVLWGATAIATAVLLDLLDPSWSAGMTPEALPPDRWVRPWEGAAARVAEQAAAARRPHLPDVPERKPAEVRAALRVARDGEAAPAADRAGAVVAETVRQLLPAGGGPVLVVAGPGWTGTVGLVAAAALAEAGVEVAVRLAREDPADAPAERRSARRRLGPAAQVLGGSLPPAALVLDAITGRGLDGPVRPPARDLVLALSATSAPVVSVDLPSGVHPAQGLVGDAVSADVTLALGAPAEGLFASGLTPFVGDLYFVDVRDEAAVDPLVRLVRDTAEGWRE